MPIEHNITVTSEPGDVDAMRELLDGLLRGPKFDTVADMLASERPALAVGEIWEAEGSPYAVVESGEHLTTSGEVKLKRLFRTMRERQSDAWGRFAEKVRRDSAITIACRGDSLTYGEDEAVDRREADGAATPSGRAHTKLRANTTYPEALSAYLNEVFASPVTVINQGYSGDNTKLGWADWGDDVSADLAVIMYGTNDAADGFSPYQPIEDYLAHYRLIIERELRREVAVVIITPPQNMAHSSGTRLLNAYRTAAEQLAAEYGCPCLDGAEITRGFSSVFFADTTHFKEIGYQRIAAAVQAFILGRAMKPERVSGGSSLSVRGDETALKLVHAHWGIQTAKSAEKSAPLTSWTGGYVVETSTYNAKVKIAFYAEQDSLIVQPSIFLRDARVEIELDEGLAQPQYALDDRVQTISGLQITDTPDASTGYSLVDASDLLDRANADLNKQQATRLHIAQRGWHTLTLYITSNGGGSPLLVLWGLSFLSFDVVRAVDRSRHVRSGAQSPVGNVTPFFVGEEYLDTSGGEYNWYKAIGTGDSSWKMMTLSPRSGAQAPGGNVTPRYMGDEYLDTTGGQYHWYKATGLESSNWKRVT